MSCSSSEDEDANINIVLDMVQEIFSVVLPVTMHRELFFRVLSENHGTETVWSVTTGRISM